MAQNYHEDVEQYDEQKAFDAHVERNRWHFLTRLEADTLLVATKRERLIPDSEWEQSMRSLVGNEAMSNSMNGAARLIAEIEQRFRDGTYPINRCPSCNRIVRTPQARQCFWCGHEWRTPSMESGHQ